MPKINKDKLKRLKKEESKIHPNSRKASQLHRLSHKSEVRQKRKDERSDKDKALWEKVCWFKEQLVEGKDKYSMTEVCDLISKYINRFQERMKEIEDANALNKQLGRHGFANVAEQSAMVMVHEKEQGSFESGHFEAPDLTNRAMVKIMKEMGDDVKELNKVKMRKFRQQKEGQTAEKENEMEVEGDNEQKQEKSDDDDIGEEKEVDDLNGGEDEEPEEPDKENSDTTE